MPARHPELLTLDVSIEGEDLSLKDVPVRGLIELLEAMVAAVEAVAREEDEPLPVLSLLEVRPGSAIYGLATKRENQPLVQKTVEFMRHRGRGATPNVLRKIHRVYDAGSRFGAIRIAGSVLPKGTKPFRMAAPEDVAPASLEEETEIQGKVVGVALSGDHFIVTLRADGGRKEEFDAEAELAKAAADLFASDVSARVVYALGTNERPQVLKIEKWEHASLVNALTEVREKLAEKGIVIRPSDWLGDND